MPNEFLDRHVSGDWGDLSEGDRQENGRAEGLRSEFRSMMPAAWLPAYPVIAFGDLTLEALMPELVVPRMSSNGSK